MTGIRSFAPGKLKLRSETLSHPRHVLLSRPSPLFEPAPLRKEPLSGATGSEVLPSILHEESLSRLLCEHLDDLCTQDWNRYAIVDALLQRCVSQPLACARRLSLARRLLDRKSPPRPTVFVKQSTTTIDEARTLIIQQFQRAGKVLMMDGGRSPALMASARRLLRELWNLESENARSFGLEGALHNFAQTFLKTQLSLLELRSAEGSAEEIYRRDS